MTPNVFSTLVIKMATSRMGAMYLIITLHSRECLKSPETLTSSMRTSGLRIHPKNRHISNPPRGIITELVRKSRKSSMVEPAPRGWMKDREL